MNTVLFMMGGTGTRFGADIPKQYIEIEGRPIYTYVIEAYAKVDEIDNIVVVSHADWIDFVIETNEKLRLQKIAGVVAGGSTRSESVLNGLTKISEFGSEHDVILIHDATHPYVDKEGTKKIIESVKKHGGATLGACQYDTMYMMDENNMLTKVVPRQFIVSGASPEAFEFGTIYNIYKNADPQYFEQMTSAGAIALANNIPMEVVPTNLVNLKITHKDDMEVCKKLLKTYFFKD